MTEIQIEVIGLIAACLTTSSFLPQVYQNMEVQKL